MNKYKINYIVSDYFEKEKIVETENIYTAIAIIDSNYPYYTVKITKIELLEK